uniref:Truncated nef protein n=1 Tax=Human immunodeficiency virus type 1 TaxID=11676 RepID=Q8USL1_HV1|nr:truncated nef protein [Human immunodeficiency virus 1]
MGGKCSKLGGWPKNEKN